MMAEHGEPCDVQDATYCMNGGTCYKISSMDTLSCICSESYKGSRCEQLQLFVQSLDSTDTGLLAAVLVVVILILVVLVFVIYNVYKMLKHRTQSQQNQKQADWNKEPNVQLL